MIRAIVESYPELLKCVPAKGPHRCSYGVISNDGQKEDIRPNSICHMSLTGGWAVPVEDGAFDQLFTSYPATDVHWFTFFDFLVGHLFKKWAHVIHLEQTPDGHHYIRISDLSAIPADILYNFCIFTRVPWEFHEDVVEWEKLVRLGMHPGFAFAVCRVGTHDDGRVHTIFHGGNNNHWPIDNTVDIRRLVSATPEHRETSYKSSRRACIPCNVMWGNTLQLRNLTGQTVEAYWLKWKEEHEDILLAS